MKKISFLSLLLALIISHGEIRANDLPEIYAVKGLGLKPRKRSAAKWMHKQALALHKKKKYIEAEKTWYKAASIDPSWWKPIFNMACASSLRGDTGRALKLMELAIERDPYRVLKSMKIDGDLRAMRRDPGYKELLARHDNKIVLCAGKPGKNSELFQTIFLCNDSTRLVYIPYPRNPSGIIKFPIYPGSTWIVVKYNNKKTAKTVIEFKPPDSRDYLKVIQFYKRNGWIDFYSVEKEKFIDDANNIDYKVYEGVGNKERLNKIVLDELQPYMEPRVTVEFDLGR